MTFDVISTKIGRGIDDECWSLRERKHGEHTDEDRISAGRANADYTA